MAAEKSNLRNVIIPGIVIVTALIIFIVTREGKEPDSPHPDPTRPAFIDQRDGQVYSELTIGSQTWMGENLRAIVLNDGTPITLIKGEKEWSDALIPAFCYYNNRKSEYRNVYGPLYNWFAVNTGKLCPVGWHVPSMAEWKQLTKFTGDSINWIMRGDSEVFVMGSAGNKLKERGNLHWKLNDSVSASDDYQFTALPGGERTVYGVFWGLGQQGIWWSSDEDEGEKADARNIEMRFDTPYVTEIQQYKKFGMSVRCVKNK